MAKKKQEEERGRRIEMEGLSQLPDTAISFGTMDWNATGNWRYIRPLYRNKTAPCAVECPAGENISRFMYLSSRGEHEEAWRVLVRDNPFPAVCGRLCDHPCETACLRETFDETVGIRDVERYLGETAIGKWALAPPKVAREERIAVVGGGPVGLACAYFLGQSGYAVTLVEAGERLGGSLRGHVDDGSLPGELLEGEIENLLAAGRIEVRRGTRLEGMAAWEELQAEHRAVLLATGRPGDGRDGGPFAGFVEVTEGRVPVDEAGFTSRESVHAAGGVTGVAGVGIAEAVRIGRSAARGIDASIRGLPAGRKAKKTEVVTLENLNLDYFIHEARVRPPDEGPGGAVGTFDAETATAESARCFHCGICIFCDNCMIFCPDVAIEKVARGYRIHYYHCKGCGICVHECPRDAMSMENELKWKK
jgi:Pyruvate/2-oxoacid:ferredoxin oxidoreductase delta subunit